MQLGSKPTTGARRPLYEQTWLLVIVCSLLPLILFVGAMLGLYQWQQRIQIEEALSNTAEGIGHSIDIAIGRPISALNALALSWDLDAPEQMAERVRPLADQEGWLNVFATNDRVQIFNLRYPLRSPTDPFGIEQTFRTGEPAVSELKMTPERWSVPYVIVRVPIKREGRVVATLGALISSAALAKEAFKGMPDSWVAAIGDRKGVILARSARPERYVGQTFLPEIADAWETGRTKPFQAATKDGVPSYMLIRQSPFAGWWVVVAAPREAVEGRFSFARNMVLGGGALSVLLASALFIALIQVVRRGRLADEQLRTVAEERAELALKQSQDDLRYALANANAGVWKWDIFTPGENWSPEMHTLLGIEPGAPSYYEAWMAVMDPEDCEPVMAAIRDFITSQRKEFNIEYRIRHPERGSRFILCIGRVTESTTVGTPRKVSGLIMDITERKASETALADALTEAREATSAKSKFLAAASHDLRQPIQSLLLFSHALKEKLEGHSVQPIVGRMLVALESLKSLLDSLLDISRLDAGIVRPDIQPVAVADLAEEMANGFRPRMAEKNLVFDLRKCDAWMATDRTLLSRVLSNLLDNALKYTEAGGTRLRFCQIGEEIRIDVTDTGIGIPPDQLDHVFEEFFQLGKTGRERRQGMGLGLATVKRVADLLGYRLKVSSRPGLGSQFSLWVPACAPSIDAQKPLADFRAGENRTILVVDDDVTILDGMTVLLASWGYRPVTATSMSQAVLALEQGTRPAAILVDFRLGAGVTGVDVIREVRSRIADNLPAILITGDTGIKGGDYSILYKPVGPDLLRKALGEAVQAPFTGTGEPTNGIAGFAIPHSKAAQARLMPEGTGAPV